MRNKVYSKLLFVILLTLGCGLNTLHAQVIQDGITYTKNAAGTAYTVTAHGNQENVVIAKEINGLPVTEIADNSFKDDKKLKSVTIAGSIQRIGQFAFLGCSELSSINFEEGADLTICRWAFNGCTSLTSIVLPSTLKRFDNNGHFKDCKKLASVTFKENNKLTDLGGYCFENCTNLKTINLSPLKTVTIMRGVFKGSGITSIIFPPKVESIQDEVFMNCASLTNIVIPASVTTIGQRGFINNTALKTVDFEEGSLLNTIGSWAFHQCTSLESIALEKCNHLTTIKDRSIRYNKLSKVIIPKSVTFIGDWAFQQKKDQNPIKYIVFYKEGGNWSDISVSTSAFAGTAVNLYGYKNVAGKMGIIDDVDNGDGTRGKETFVPVAPIEIKENCDGYTTYFNSNCAIQLPETITAYKVISVSQDKATLFALPSDTPLPKSNPVVIKGEAGIYYPRILPEDVTPALTGNLLKGSENEETTTGGTVYYKLSLNNTGETGTAAFYHGSTGGTAFTNPANKAYLALNLSLGTTLSLVLTDTGIKLNPKTNQQSNVRYNLSGERVNESYKGLIIANGKKIVIK